MGTTDIDVIKEIPGYKVILKAVVKSQIQQLVEQLAEHTNEESVILTASVADGTISHIGSESGKSFLQDNDDFKSQFLGFCLKYHHRKQMEKEKEKAEKEERERQELLQQQQQQQQMMQQQLAFSQPPRFSRSPRQFSPRFPSPRHQPYPSGRPPRRPPAPNFGPGQGVQGLAMPGARNVKVEPSDSDEASNQSGTDAGNVKHETTGSVQESGANTDNENRDSDGSNLAAGDQGGEQQGSGSGPQTPGSDPDINVKLEALTEEELDLEITGVEPGTAGAGMSQSEWDPNASLGMDYGQGATGSSADMQGQAGYSEGSQSPRGWPDYSLYFCPFCNRNFLTEEKFNAHVNTHTSIVTKPFKCELCVKSFSDKPNLRKHMRIHTGEMPYECSVCLRRFRSSSNRNRHLSVHYKKVETPSIN
ncbi:zinc finger and SCAN domain-containing protein 4-like isoform X4 [Mya arenaria]|uniref:zinc finger and SCAN domain-containing protein 4-like isoform X4 n=1 Tax=Mya arenaria TaxID=6604 RepID=UPI0022E03BB3|nr:zinc finger and SCAN domain-containing protein 4-like isoform X4 [Mya arenaria]